MSFGRLRLHFEFLWPFGPNLSIWRQRQFALLIVIFHGAHSNSSIWEWLMDFRRRKKELEKFSGLFLNFCSNFCVLKICCLLCDLFHREKYSLLKSGLMTYKAFFKTGFDCDQTLLKSRLVEFDGWVCWLMMNSFLCLNLNLAAKLPSSFCCFVFLHSLVVRCCA